MNARSHSAARRAAPASARRHRGYMLIEVLVSVLIFSIGVLALIGLQAKMTRAQTASKTRADATYLANELVGVMWSDMKNLGSYANCASYARCTDWQGKVTASLPGGAGTVTIVDATTGEVSITITWTQGSDGSHTYTTTTFVRAS
jgi:type IV pilus assembly protein PilV